jgi:hypothetical protein
MSRMEQHIRGLAAERESNLKNIQHLEAQIQQVESAQKMQMDRANERLKNYERALFDTRQVLAMKDAKIATLESNVSRLSGGQPPNSGRASSAADNSGAGYTPGVTPAYSSVQVCMYEDQQLHLCNLYWLEQLRESAPCMIHI